MNNDDPRFGVLGTALTIVTALIGWLVKHEAELRATSLCVSIVVGLLTAAWWIRKHWDKKGKDE